MRRSAAIDAISIGVAESGYESVGAIPPWLPLTLWGDALERGRHSGHGRPRGHRPYGQIILSFSNAEADYFLTFYSVLKKHSALSTQESTQHFTISGSVTVKVVPTPALLSTEISPPCKSIHCFTINNPNPLPATAPI